MLSSTFARSARVIQPSFRASTLFLRGSRCVSTLPDHPHIVSPLPLYSQPHTNITTVRAQTPHRPRYIPPHSPPHRASEPKTRNRRLYLSPTHAPKLHTKLFVPLYPFFRLRAPRNLRPRCDLTSRRLRFPRRFQPLRTTHRRVRRGHASRRCWGRRARWMDTC
jgi:hypothetical protein